MKKNSIYDLQLFAEDGGTQEVTADNTAQEQSTKTTEPTTKEDKGAENSKKQLKYSDEDVDRILNKKFADWQQKKEKEVSEAKKLAEMNAQEKAEYERDQLKKQLDELKRRDSLSEMTKTARKMLTDENINVSDELLAVMVTTDAEQTKTAIDGFIKLFKESVETTVKEKIRGEAPKRGNGGVASMTKDQIMAIKDPELRQQKILENRSLFNI